MARAKSAYVCNECGGESAKWQGQCPSCKQWNTLVEFKISGSSRSTNANRSGFAGQLASLTALSEVELQEVPRVHTGFAELDRVLGGGLVAGSAVLIGGHPGAGKSTLLLQTVCQLAAHYPTLYVTGEESLAQVAMRARRLSLPAAGVSMLAETDIDQILRQVEQNRPRILVVDSIQVMHLNALDSAPGSVAQVRECAAALTRMAKQTNTILLLVGHVTKEGSLAGPKVLEHMIDCSLVLESTEDSRYRTLRSQKNRFGAVNELGVFAMLDTGLREVSNPSAIFLNRSEEMSSGSTVTLLWEGTRALLVEMQALVDESNGGYPRRVAVGLDQNRLTMLLAVLHRHGGLFTADQDVYINVVSGLKINETSADLAALIAVVSSLRNQALPRELAIFGEIGLNGEVRAVPHGEERLQSAVKQGFSKVILPYANRPRKMPENVQVHPVKTLQQALQLVQDF